MKILETFMFKEKSREGKGGRGGLL